MKAETNRPLVPHGGNDEVMTPPELARAIVAHFRPSGRILEPCRGTGSFTDAMPDCNWCDRVQGQDFLTTLFLSPFDWIVTNPPWSKFRPFLLKSMLVADNVVFLVTTNHFMTKARRQDMRDQGFAFVEILEVPTPAKPWPQSGFQVAAVHIKRGYRKPVKVNQLNP